MPSQTAGHSSPADDLVGQERMEIEDRVDLRGGHVRPAEAERRDAQLHRPEHEARLLAHRLGRLVAVSNDAPFITGAALASFPASSGDKAAPHPVFARHSIAESVERWRDRWIDFRADIRARYRIDLVVEDSPGGQPLDIVPIERDNAGVGELRRRTQLAGAERGRRASDAGEVGRDRIETLAQRHGSRETCTLDAEARLGGNPARILELVADEAVSAGWDWLKGRHCVAS